MSDRVKGVLPPTPRMRGHLLRILTAESKQFICISEMPYGQNVHWWGNRSHECHHDKGQCEGCKRGWPSKWKGYLHVQTDVHGGDVFLELTATAWLLIEQQVPAGENFRGIIFRIRRTKGGAKGRYLVEVLPRRISEEELPREKDPRDLLRFLWSCKRPSGQMQE